MDEPDVHAELDLFDGLTLDQVRPDPPVLLGRVDHVVVDPTAVGRLQQRMVEEEAEPATRLDDTCDLGDRRIDGIDVLEHEARHAGIEAGVGEGQLIGGRSQIVRATSPLMGDTDLIPGRVDADHVRPAGRQHPADLPVTAADVEDRAGPGQLGRSQRQDLLLVLGVGAIGEAVDPPPGVVFPQISGRVAVLLARHPRHVTSRSWNQM